mmetsp:Transcript_107636/g.304470  ORF Transcript_107636/g.304470 Transcript_107636/m.304470 type:complete len:254 (-) Transcript_107636:92-853(-)
MAARLARGLPRRVDEPTFATSQCRKPGLAVRVPGEAGALAAEGGHGRGAAVPRREPVGHGEHFRQRLRPLDVRVKDEDTLILEARSKNLAQAPDRLPRVAPAQQREARAQRGPQPQPAAKPQQQLLAAPSGRWGPSRQGAQAADQDRAPHLDKVCLESVDVESTFSRGGGAPGPPALHLGHGLSRTRRASLSSSEDLDHGPLDSRGLGITPTPRATGTRLGEACPGEAVADHAGRHSGSQPPSPFPATMPLPA